MNRLKCDYIITPNSNVQHYFYYLNNNKYPAKNRMWHSTHGTKRQMLYAITEHQDNHRFISESHSMNGMLNIFQSDCDVIIHHLNCTYNFDSIKNA